jgi:hypothetical protein
MIRIQILELPHKISTYEKANELKMLNAKVAGSGNGDNSKAPQKTQGGKSSKERSSFPFSFSSGGLCGSRANYPFLGLRPHYQKIASIPAGWMSETSDIASKHFYFRSA